MSTPVTVPPGFTVRELVECARREVRMRERVYPAWVQRGRMTHGRARAETEGMKAIVSVLEQLGEVPPIQPGLPGVES